MVVDGTSVDVTAKDVSEVVEMGVAMGIVEVDEGSVAGMADEGSKAVEVGAASIVDRASVVVAATKDESVSVEEGLEAAIEGEIPARVEE